MRNTDFPLQTNQRMYNLKLDSLIYAGYLELLVKPAQIEKISVENQVKIDPDDTTIRAFLEVGQETFSLRQSLHSQKKLNAEVLQGSTLP